MMTADHGVVLQRRSVAMVKNWFHNIIIISTVHLQFGGGEHNGDGWDPG
jgi:hypothetical protein